MTATFSRGAARQKRHARLRLHLAGDASRPRLAVFRSLNHIYAQVIDDASGRTLAAASSLEPELRSASGTKSADAAVVGRLVAERAKAAGVGKVVFDRAGFRYHGRV
jgi:large subunit ribosomal protein L18